MALHTREIKIEEKGETGKEKAAYKQAMVRSDVLTTE